MVAIHVSLLLICFVLGRAPGDRIGITRRQLQNFQHREDNSESPATLAFSDSTEIGDIDARIDNLRREFDSLLRARQEILGTGKGVDGKK